MQISSKHIELCVIFSLTLLSIVYSQAQSQTEQTKPQTKSLTPKAQATQRPQVSDSALDDALNDKRFIQRQIKCALGQAPCDPIGRRLKTLAPLVLRGACPQCTPQETKQIQRTLSYVQRNFPQEWSKIVKQYAG